MTVAAAAMLLLELSPAYPIPPESLRSVYRAADLVVVVRAGKTVPLNREEFWEDSKVTLTISRTLKGRSAGNEITVVYCPNMICPSPDRYPEGKTVLAFLVWNPKLKAYNTVALSYGTKVLEEAELKTYLQRIEELEKIPAEKRFDEPSDETIEWLVRCMEHPATRWEGAYEFSQPTFWIQKGKDAEPPKAIPRTRLKNDQWKRIVNSFLEAKEFSPGESAVLSLVVLLPEPRIDRLLKRELSRLCTDAGCEPYYGDRIMQALVDRLDFRKGAGLVRRFESLEYSDKKGRLAILKEFLDLLEKE